MGATYPVWWDIGTQALAWEPGPNGSGIDLQLVREWAQHSWSGVEAEEADEVRGS